MCRSAQKGLMLKQLIAEARARREKRKAQQVAAPAKAPSLGAALIVFLRKKSRGRQ
jgi:hypothetical protein